jgi:hypothetical protein
MRSRPFASILAASVGMLAMSPGFATGPAANITLLDIGGPRVTSDRPQVRASREAQTRTTHVRAPYTPMSQANRDRLPTIKVATKLNHYSPGTRQRRRRQQERRVRGGGK